MPVEQRAFAIVTGAQASHLLQRVVRVLRVEGEVAHIQFGTDILSLPAANLRPVSNVAFDVGDRVRCEGGDAMIRDIIWHFKDNEPNYYLDFGEKKTPKRYRDRDLEATSPAQ